MAYSRSTEGKWSVMKGDLVSKFFEVLNITKKPVRVTIALLLLGSLVAAGNQAEWVLLTMVGCFTALIIAFATWLDTVVSGDYPTLVALVDQIDAGLNCVVELFLGWSFPFLVWVTIVILSYEITGSLYWFWAPLVAIVAGLAVYFVTLGAGLSIEDERNDEAYEVSSYD